MQTLQSLQTALDQVYQSMIGRSAELTGLAMAIAGIAALTFISYRAWGNIARAEGIKPLPLLRPFAIGIAISLFPSVIALINGVMQPTVVGTSALVNDSNQAITALLQQRQLALQQSNDWQMYVGPDGSGSKDKWEQLSGDADSGVLSGVSNWAKFEMAKASYNMKNSVKVWLSEILQVGFESAALCINTIRTFWLLILAILGPLTFGISIFDGFHHMLTTWLAKYLNVFLWLPVANIFGSLIGQLQQEMIKLDLQQLQASGQTSFGPTDAAYIIFLVMGIAGYVTVPFVTNYIVHAGGQRLGKYVH